MKHSPGPWHFDNGVTFVAVHTSDRRKTVHFNSQPEIGREEAEANARLIAEAPELP